MYYRSTAMDRYSPLALTDYALLVHAGEMCELAAELHNISLHDCCMARVEYEQTINTPLSTARRANGSFVCDCPW